MPTSFPGARDNLTNPTAADALSSAVVPHASQHTNANDAIEAIEDWALKIGTPGGPAGPLTAEGKLPASQSATAVVDVAAPTGIAATDTAAIQGALNSLATTGGLVRLQWGRYLINAALTAPATDAVRGIGIIGMGRGATVIALSGAIRGISFVGTGSNGIQNALIADLTVEGSASSLEGIRLEWVHHSTVERVEVAFCGTVGIYVRHAFYNAIRDCWAHDNVSHGLLVGAIANATYVFGGHYRINGGNQLRFDSEGNASRLHGCSVFGATVEHPGLAAHGVAVYDCDEIRIVGCYIETNDATATHYAVHVDAPASAARYNLVSGCNLAGTAKSLFIGRSQDTIIEHNSINREVVVGANSVRANIGLNHRVDLGVADGGASTRYTHRPTDSVANYIKNGTNEFSYEVGGAASVFRSTKYVDWRVGGVTTFRLRDDTFRARAVYGFEMDPGRSFVLETDRILRGGAGTPEGAVVAPVGSLYLRTDGAAGTTLYIKESGVGNTGWVAK